MLRYISLLESVSPSIVVASGPSGTGKTMQACKVGQRMVGAGTYDKIILTRPAVTSEENHGFIPGSLDDKMAPWIKPSLQYIGKKIQYEICPLAYMRGLTFNKSWIIADEMQNSTESQMLMLLTRIGFGSKLVILGDTEQTDGNYRGLSDLIKKISKVEDSPIAHVRLDEIKRNPIISEILSMYDTPSI